MYPSLHLLTVGSNWGDCWFSVTPFKIDQNKKSKASNRLNPESGNRKIVDMQRLSPRFRSQQFFLWKLCAVMFSPNL